MNKHPNSMIEGLNHPRSTAELIATANAEWNGHPPSIVSRMADRLAELDADLFEQRCIADEHLRTIGYFDAFRPPCPTCGGTHEIKKLVTVNSNEVVAGARIYQATRCPDCTDGKVPIERMANVFSKVHDSALDASSCQYVKALRRTR